MSIETSFCLPRTGTVLRNRSVLAAMTNKQSAEDGTLSEDEVQWLARRASGGFGIVTTAAILLGMVLCILPGLLLAAAHAPSGPKVVPRPGDRQSFQ